jgi:bifunctional UDP-N-acetylglucosamine pyrophosphorylase/glucosamine-1-phosphate N-acetyltransferase
MKSVEGAAALVLAAGKGTRMKSSRAKVLHNLLEEPLLRFPLKSLADSGIGNVAVVVGHGSDEVESYLGSTWPEVSVIHQTDQKGTGHAVQVAGSWWEAHPTLLILPGDAPLLPPEAIASLLTTHLSSRSAATFLTFEAENPTGYGRVVRKPGGCRIVEEKDASLEEKKISEVNSGIYAFETACLSKVISLLDNRNAQGELYLPDVLRLLGETGDHVEALLWPNPEDLSGINDPLQLAAANRAMRNRIVKAHLLAGVKMLDPETTWIGPEVILEPDVFLEPNVQIWGNSVVETGTTVGSHTILRNVHLGKESHVLAFCHVTNSVIGPGAKVGPFACLRDNTRLAAMALAGKFVEIKNSNIGEGSKVPHLSYMGDATIGKQSNIGAGTITCNYDGVRKNPTKIGDRCFVGSDTMLVAPVTLQDDSFTAAGSTITEDVPPGALAVGRARQRNIEGWARRKNAANRKEED